MSLYEMQDIHVRTSSLTFGALFLCTTNNYYILALTGISLSLCGRGDREKRFPLLNFLPLFIEHFHYRQFSCAIF